MMDVIDKPFAILLMITFLFINVHMCTYCNIGTHMYTCESTHLQIKAFMKEETKQKRHMEIEHAAYALLAEFGFEGTSMLNIAKKANASNQTLYRWYGDKVGLFKRMVENNAREIKLQLETALATQSDQLSALRDVGPMLLDMLLGERAIMLNRAAASDKSLRLGKIIAECGRNQIFPLVDDLVASAMEQEVVSFSSSESGATLYINLLIGDLQIRRVIGVLDKPTNGEITERSRDAFEAFLLLGSKTSVS